MKQKLLLAISSLLGGIIAFILPSCHTQKNATQSDNNKPVATLEQNKGIMCLYGVPPEVYRQQHVQDSIVTDTTIVNE